MTLPHPRFLAFLAVFICTVAVALFRLSVEGAMILGFNLAAVVFIAMALPLWLADGPEAARARAARDDGGRILLMLTSVAVIGAILLALGKMIGGIKGLSPSDFAIVAGTLVLTWIFSNLVYAFHYAHVFYDQKDEGDAGGILFPEGSRPIFSDFVYFAFTIGMTCQTADLNITSRHIRRVVTLHGLFAFFFNLGVLALTINVLSGII